MRISTLKKLRKINMFISKVAGLTSGGIGFYWLFRYGYAEEHDGDIFLTAFAAVLIFGIISLIFWSISDCFKLKLNNIYSYRRMQEQEIQMRIENARRNTVLY